MFLILFFIFFKIGCHVIQRLSAILQMPSESDTSYQNDADESLLPPRVSDEVRIYKTRWYILALYCSVAVLQNMMWNTWGPIQATARAVYKWQDYVIDLMAAWGSITFCLTMVPFAWLMDVKGRWEDHGLDSRNI